MFMVLDHQNIFLNFVISVDLFIFSMYILFFLPASRAIAGPNNTTPIYIACSRIILCISNGEGGGEKDAQINIFIRFSA